MLLNIFEPNSRFVVTDNLMIAKLIKDIDGSYVNIQLDLIIVSLNHSLEQNALIDFSHSYISSHSPHV